MPFPIIYIVFFNEEAPRTQRIAEYIVNASACLRGLCVSALKTKKNENMTLLLRPGTILALFSPHPGTPAL